ncbi:MAG: hypothetical protein P794_05815 [Epsilonproteobacteria bacterium (ex Lamellibrachia satsuma)]|nr:MAG: hypothetical protein P794_05815 [Epsilonproteobacteria bacterium (ex Lamellibrachia satsuma)]
MKEINVLIVEDESIVAMEIESYVLKLVYTVTDVCSSGEETLAAISEHHVDIILMDICIDGEKDGIETAAEILKRYPAIKIIFLTAHTDEYNVDRAISLDPIAYLSKPFKRDELQIFLKIATKKIKQEFTCIQNDPNKVIFDQEFYYDTVNSLLYCCGEQIHLTKKEHMLLDLLIRNRNSIVYLDAIEREIWPDKETNANTIRTLVKRLRQKLKYKFIETVSSMGYKLVIPKNGL